MTVARPEPVASPCLSICRMHEGTAWCEGCLRTIDEIAVWSTLDDAAKRAVLAQLPQRRVKWRRARQVEDAEASKIDSATR